MSCVLLRAGGIVASAVKKALIQAAASLRGHGLPSFEREEADTLRNDVPQRDEGAYPRRDGFPECPEGLRSLDLEMSAL